MKLKKLTDWGFQTANSTYVIAEIGINHGGDFSKAIELIESASRTGCDAVKFQTYLTEKRAPKGNQHIYDILKKCELPFDDFKKLKVCAEENGLQFFSTAFDSESIDCLESIETPFYKVASFDIVNRELLRKLASIKKPMIISVGMANLTEIDLALDVLDRDSKLTLLHCVSAYPTPEVDANLNAISVLQDRFTNCVIGYSDHTCGIKVPAFASVMGAQVIEKHYKIDDLMPCVDAPVSITESQMTCLVNEIRSIEKILGNGEVGVSEIQKPTLIFRRPS
jgi:sialic acid synthase SpsE